MTDVSQYMNKAIKLNDVYWDACDMYTMYMQTGSEIFKVKAEAIFRIYRNRGGKRDKLILHSIY